MGLVPIGTVDAKAGTAVDAGTDSLSAQDFLLDDFNHGAVQSTLAGISGDAPWYAYTDADRGGSSTIIPASLPTDFSQGYVTAGAWEGASAHATFCLTPPLIDPSGSIALKTEPDSLHPLDCTRMGSFSFMARGKGTIRVIFVTRRVLGYPSNMQQGHFGYTLTLPSVWTKITIDSSMIAPAPGSVQVTDGLKWSDGRDSVTAIVFGSWSTVKGDTIDLWLDDVRAKGLNWGDVRR